jgi:hypothetical protein
MTAEYDFCKHDGCQKKVLNKTGLCGEHRKQKCRMRSCKVMITGRQGGIYCEKHMKLKPREEVETWSVGV